MRLLLMMLRLMLRVRLAGEGERIRARVWARAQVRMRARVRVREGVVWSWGRRRTGHGRRRGDVLGQGGVDGLGTDLHLLHPNAGFIGREHLAHELYRFKI